MTHDKTICNNLLLTKRKNSLRFAPEFRNTLADKRRYTRKKQFDVNTVDNPFHYQTSFVSTDNTTPRNNDKRWNFCRCVDAGEFVTLMMLS